MKIANAECVQSKLYRVLTPVNSNLTGDYLIRAEDGLEMFVNYTRQSLLFVHVKLVVSACQLCCVNPKLIV